MAIKKKFSDITTPLMWNGDEVATIRGLTPDDITLILMAEGDGIAEVFGLADKLAEEGVNLKDTNEIADHVMAKGPKLMMELATRVPGLLARIIAVACNEPEEEAANEIRATWVLPLQFEALTLVAKLTFVGIDGFRLFLGNAQALAASVSAITNVKNSRQNRQKTMSTELPDGAKEFLERVPS